MRKITCGLVAMLTVLLVADTVSARPFDRVWEKRRAELYARLSRDVSLRVHSRVSATKAELQDSLDSKFVEEAAKLQAQLATGSQDVDDRVGKEIQGLHQSFATESKALRERFDLQLQDLT